MLTPGIFSGSKLEITGIIKHPFTLQFTLPFTHFHFIIRKTQMPKKNRTHLSPFRSLMRDRRRCFVSSSKFSTSLSIQLSRTSDRVLDDIFPLQIGHSNLRFIHSLMQYEQKLCAQFKVTACKTKTGGLISERWYIHLLV